MRPPICYSCRKRFSPSKEGGKVRFKLSEEDKVYNKRFEKEGFVGHPKGLEWFCEKHIEKAKSLKHLTIKEASSLLKNGQKVSETIAKTETSWWDKIRDFFRL